jgi:thioredoxin reductase (NADPH)
MSRDLVVIGAGPAGISAALWARSLDLDGVVLERSDRPGGQLHLIHFALRNVVGAVGLTGAELAARIVPPATASLDLQLGAEVTGIDPEAGWVRLEGGAAIETRAMLIATGLRRRRLEATGAERLTGRGVSYSATADRERFAGHAMLVVGGGDAAYENALILADAGCRVTLVVRAAPRARREFRERVGARESIRVWEGAQAVEVLGEDSVHAARVRDARGVETTPCDGIVVKIGMVPNSEPFRSVLETDAAGYLVTDRGFRTSHPRVWAAGDVARPEPPGIPVAWGHGAVAVEAIRKALRGPAARASDQPLADRFPTTG